MIVAETEAGEQVEATRDLECSRAHCPMCRAPVVLKRGRVKVPHFAHAAGSACDAAGESLRHLQAKRVLADQFRHLGYAVWLEEAHRDLGRRVDVAVAVPPGQRVAVEVQDSPISVDDMKRRHGIDRRIGFAGTVWVFTGRRHDLLLPAEAGQERRPPEEMRWLNNRYGHGVHVLDAIGGTLWRVRFGSVARAGSSCPCEDGCDTCGYAGGYPGRRLRATKTVHPDRVGFRLSCAAGRYHKPEQPDWHVGFHDLEAGP